VPRFTKRGFTLIELTVSITVLAIAAAGVLAAMSVVSSRSASDMVTEQATAIAAAYLNEVLQKPFGSHPSGVTVVLSGYRTLYP
jgi:prepilin-type N-terminal cleavage/methylation domain-containing protein